MFVERYPRLQFASGVVFGMQQATVHRFLDIEEG